MENALDAIGHLRKAGANILMDDAGEKFMRLYFTDKKKIIGKCPLGKTDLYIESNGNVRTGCWVLPAVGNIKDMRLEKIVEGDRYQENLKKMLKRECCGCTCGYLMQGKYLT